MNGKRIMVYLDGVAIAQTIANDVECSAELQPFSSPSTADYKEYMAGDKQWVVNTNFLVLSTADALAAIKKTGNTFTLVIGTAGQTGTTKYGLTGQAILKIGKISTPNNSLVKGSFVFQGTGELTEVQQPTNEE